MTWDQAANDVTEIHVASEKLVQVEWYSSNFSNFLRFKPQGHSES